MWVLLFELLIEEFYTIFESTKYYFYITYKIIIFTLRYPSNTPFWVLEGQGTSTSNRKIAECISSYCFQKCINIRCPGQQEMLRLRCLHVNISRNVLKFPPLSTNGKSSKLRQKHFTVDLSRL